MSEKPVMENAMRSLVAITAAASLVFTQQASAESNALRETTTTGEWRGIHAIEATKGYAETPMGQVHYWQMGDEGQAVLLLHQTPWFSIQYANAMPYFRDGGLAPIAIDTPGFGLSDIPSRLPTIEEYADNIIPVLNALEIERIAIVGHHTGASIAAAFASRHPNRTDCVVLHGTPLYTDKQKAQRLSAMNDHVKMLLEEDGAHFSNRYSRVRNLFAKSASLESVNWSAMSFYWAGPDEWYGHRAAFTFDMENALMAIKPPTLIISNTGDSLHASDKRARKLRPDFSYAEFEGGDSHFIFDNPNAWANAVIEFVAENCE